MVKRDSLAFKGWKKASELRQSTTRIQPVFRFLLYHPCLVPHIGVHPSAKTEVYLCWNIKLQIFFMQKKIIINVFRKSFIRNVFQYIDIFSKFDCKPQPRTSRTLTRICWIKLEVNCIHTRYFRRIFNKFDSSKRIDCIGLSEVSISLITW